MTSRKPLRLKGLKQVFALVALTLGASGFARAEDIPPSPAARAVAEAFEKSPVHKDAVNDSFVRYGDIMQQVIPASAFAITYLEDDRAGRVDLIKGCALTMAGTGVLKALFNMTRLGVRPSGGKKSYPSGHAASAMCGAAFLQQRYGSEYGVPAYALATGVALSRVHAGKHHLHDVMTSTILAHTVAEGIENNGRQDMNNRYSLSQDFAHPLGRREVEALTMGPQAIRNQPAEIGFYMFPDIDRGNESFGVMLTVSKKF